MTDGFVVILSYPDTVVRPAYSEFSSKVWPLFGVGTKHAVQAGHAALLLIEKKSGKVEYFDFGRYITSTGYGRVRSKDTDVELEVPIKAKVANDEVSNLEALLLWLEAHPEKTHGEGRLVAGVNALVDYQKAKDYIAYLVEEKEIAYGAFVKKGSNCARFVTDTLVNSCVNRSVKAKLKTSNLFTPSPIGNVIKGTTQDKIYEVFQQKIRAYENRSVLKEYFACFLNKFDRELNLLGTELPNKTLFDLENGTWLGGIGSGAWFRIENKVSERFQIARYAHDGTLEFEGDFKVNDNSFAFCKTYQFVHPTNCKEAFVVQENKTFLFARIE